jgi:hypothetical protein
MTVEIKVVVTVVFRQRENVLLHRVNVDEVIAVIEIDVSDGGNHHTTGLGTLDGLGTIVCQTV